MALDFGALKTVTGTNVAANTEIAEAVPNDKYWKLVCVSVALVQGITQTPQPILQIKDAAGAVLFESFGCTTAQAVSTTCQYTWAPGLTLTGLIGATTNVHACAPLPYELVIGEGATINTVTIGKGANSDYGAPVIYVAEFAI